MKPFGYARAATAREALLAARRPGTLLLGGGTDLLREMKAGLRAPAELVDVSRIGAWRGHACDARRGLRAGAAVRLAELEGDAAVARLYPALHQAIAGAATPQLRNMATLAGSLLQRPSCWYYRGGFPCWLRGDTVCSAQAGDNRHGGVLGGGPCIAGHPSDTAAALIALGASAVVLGGRRSRTVPVERLYGLPSAREPRETRLATGEVVSELRLPAPARGARSVYLRARDRATWCFALVAVAAAGVVSGGILREVRLIAAGVAPVPWRLEPAEAVARGERLDEAVARRAGERAVEQAAPHPTAAYKLPILQALVRRALLALVT